MFKQIFIFGFSVFIVNCQQSNSIDKTAQLDGAELQGKSFAVLAKSNSDVALLGILQFSEIFDSHIDGSWHFETWGSNKLFPEFPANNGTVFPMNADMGKFRGTQYGNEIIIPIDIAGTSKSIGIILKKYENEKLSGRLSLLPNLEFDGVIDGREIKADFNPESFLSAI